MPNLPLSSGAPVPGGLFARDASASFVGFLRPPLRAGLYGLPTRRPARPAPATKEPSPSTSPSWQNLVLTESLPENVPPLNQVLESVHPDAMLSGRLRVGLPDWPSRPDVIRSEALLPQVPPDHPEYYPHRDGDNLAESTLHADALIDLRVNLRTATAHLPRTYTGLDQLINYDKQNRSLVLAPDIYVLTQTDIKPGDDVKSLRTWEQGVPVFVLELVSDSSLKRDLGHKLRIYARIGVQEYVVWDPLEEYLTPKLRYFRRVGTEYVEQTLERTPTGEPSVTLEVLPVRLLCAGYRLRVQSTETGELFQSAEEEREQRMTLETTTRELNRQLQAESVRADSERVRAEAAQQQAEAERVRAEAAQQQAEAERQRTKAERQRAEAAQQQAEGERVRAEAAQQQAEVERQRAEAAQQQAGAAQQQAEAERVRAEAAQQQAEAERVRAEAAQQQAEAERRRAEAAQEQVATERGRAEAEQARAAVAQKQVDAERLRVMEAMAREQEAQQRVEAQALELATLRALLASLSPATPG